MARGDGFLLIEVGRAVGGTRRRMIWLVLRIVGFALDVVGFLLVVEQQEQIW